MHIGGIQKDAKVVVSIISELEKKGKLDLFDFYFVGENQPQNLLSYAKSPRVHALGAINDKAKADLLSSMDAMILPAVENFSKAMLEGLASGLYIISNKMNPGAKEVLNLGAKIGFADCAREYVNTLTGLAERKNRKILPSYKKINRNVSLQFDRVGVLSRIKKMFDEINDREEDKI